MKLTSIEIHPDPSSAGPGLVLSFRDPKALNPYRAKSVVGLAPEEITAKYYGSATGSKFHDLILAPREFTFNIGLNPDFAALETYSELRDAIYKTISASRTGMVFVQFKNLTEVVAVCGGFVTKVDTDHFDRDQQIQMIIRCDDSMLMAPVPIDVPLVGLDPSNTIINDIKSTAPHGLYFELAIDSAFSTLIIQDPFNFTAWTFSCSPVGGFASGDVLYFSSYLNDKKLYLLKADMTTVQLADVLADDTTWPIIFPGVNALHLAPSANFHWQKIKYYPTYWGV